MNRNKSAGHGWELEVIQDLIKVGYDDAVSSRQESRSMDNKKVDVCYTDPFNFQCKNMVGKVDYHTILSEMPNDEKINVVLHKMTRKANKNFVCKGKYAIMNYEDFLTILSYLDEIDRRSENKVRE